MKKYLHSAPTAFIEMSHNTLNSWTSEAMPTSLGVSVRRTYGFKWQNIWQNEHSPSDFALKDPHCQPIWTLLWLSWTLNGPAQRSFIAFPNFTAFLFCHEDLIALLDIKAFNITPLLGFKLQFLSTLGNCNVLLNLGMNFGK